MGAIEGRTEVSIDGAALIPCDNFSFQKEMDSIRDKFTNVLGVKFKELGKGLKSLSTCASIVKGEANNLIDALGKAYPAPDIKTTTHSDPARNLVETNWDYDRVPRKMKKRLRKAHRNELFINMTIPSSMVEIKPMPMTMGSQVT